MSSHSTPLSAPVSLITTNLFLSPSAVRSLESIYLKRSKITPTADSLGGYEVRLMLRHQNGYFIRFFHKPTWHLLSGEKRNGRNPYLTRTIYTTNSFVEADYVFCLIDYAAFFMKDRWLPKIMMDHIESWGKILYPSTGRAYSENRKVGVYSSTMLQFHNVLQTEIGALDGTAVDQRFMTGIVFHQSGMVLTKLLALEEIFRKDGRLADIYRDSTREQNIVNGKEVDVQLLTQVWKDKSLPALPVALPLSVAVKAVADKSEEKNEIDLREEEKNEVDGENKEKEEKKTETPEKKTEAMEQAEWKETVEDVYGPLFQLHRCPRCLKLGCECWQWNEQLYNDLVDSLVDNHNPLPTESIYCHEELNDLEIETSKKARFI